MSSERSQPPGWVSVPLGCLLREPLRNGHSAKASGNGSGVPTLTLSAVTHQNFSADNVKQTVADPARVRDLWLEPDDILIERANTPDLVGTAALFPGPSGFAIFPDLMIRARLESEFNVRYVAAFLKSLDARRHFRNRAQGIAGSMPKIGQGAIEALTIPLAPRPEQDRIVAVIEQYLTDIDAGVATLECALLNLKRYRASILKAACEGKLVPTEAELARKEGRDYEPASVLLRRILKERRARWEAEQLAKMAAKGQVPKDDKWKAKYEEPAPPPVAGLPALPDGWVWTTIATVGDVLLGRQRAPQYLTGKWPRPYLRVANIKDDRIDYSDVEEMDFDPEHFEKYKLQPGDILASEGQSPDRVGESAIYAGGIEGLCFQKTLHRFRPVPSGPSAKFAQIVFRAHVKTGVFRKMASITTNIAHLTLEKFEAAPFPLPPVAEQHRIATEVDRLLSIADETETAIRAQLKRAEALRRAILKHAFEGKLVPQDPSDEPAHVTLERLRAERAARALGGVGKAARSKRATVRPEAPQGDEGHG